MKELPDTIETYYCPDCHCRFRKSNLDSFVCRMCGNVNANKEHELSIMAHELYERVSGKTR